MFYGDNSKYEGYWNLGKQHGKGLFIDSKGISTLRYLE